MTREEMIQELNILAKRIETNALYIVNSIKNKRKRDGKL